MHQAGVAKLLKVKEHFEPMVCKTAHSIEPNQMPKWINITLFFIYFIRLDYDMATQRMCVQRGPSDSEDRCAHTIYNYKKVYMCFCRGDLCNASSVLKAPNSFQIFVATSILLVLMQLVSNYWISLRWDLFYCVYSYYVHAIMTNFVHSVKT